MIDRQPAMTSLLSILSSCKDGSFFDLPGFLRNFQIVWLHTQLKQSNVLFFSSGVILIKVSYASFEIKSAFIIFAWHVIAMLDIYINLSDFIPAGAKPKKLYRLIEMTNLNWNLSLVAKYSKHLCCRFPPSGKRLLFLIRYWGVNIDVVSSNT